MEIAIKKTIPAIYNFQFVLGAFSEDYDESIKVSVQGDMTGLRLESVPDIHEFREYILDCLKKWDDSFDWDLESEGYFQPHLIEKANGTQEKS